MVLHRTFRLAFRCQNVIARLHDSSVSTSPLVRVKGNNIRKSSTFASPPSGQESQKITSIPSCPSPTCECASMPAMPWGYKINQSNPLNNTMPSYAEQILICTGEDNWQSDITQDNDGDNLAADLKNYIGRGAIYSNPYYKTMVTNASFKPSTSEQSPKSTSAYLLPSFKYITNIDRTSPSAIEDLVKGFLLPSESDDVAQWVPLQDKDRLLRKIDYQSSLQVHDVRDILILICGHGGRDIRCGILGPLLKAEFQRVLALKKIKDVEEQPETADGVEEYQHTARVGVISHISGHKFAGNVIIYVPPSLRLSDQPHPLAGCSIWYGRVEPKHVEGIVQETVLGGRLIKNLLRGSMTQDRQHIEV